MLEPCSAIASAYTTGHLGGVNGVTGVTIRERTFRNLVQLSSSPEHFNAVCDHLAALLKCDVPVDLTSATSFTDGVVFRVGPERVWIAETLNTQKPVPFDVASLGGNAIVTDIGHSRTVLRISGPEAKTLMSRGLPVDLDENVFLVNSVAQSTIHHIPVLVHRVDSTNEMIFEAYVSRDLAMTFWEWLTEAATPLGCEILKPD